MIGSFLRSLTGRSAQIEPVLRQAAVDSAIEAMVFIGGALNLKLLGGSSADLSAVTVGN